MLIYILLYLFIYLAVSKNALIFFFKLSYFNLFLKSIEEWFMKTWPKLTVD